MIDIANADGIISTYTKYGWQLRRIVTSDPSHELDKYGVPVYPSDIDAAWFSRPPAASGVPWEVRYLGEVPFSLIENLDESDEAFEEQLSGVEDRLRERIASKRAA